MTEELNNIDNPLPNETFTAAQAIEAVNRLLWSENFEDAQIEDARVIKAFLVGTLPNIPVPVKHSKIIPVMHTTIEGAQKRIKLVIDWAIAVHEGKTVGIRKSDALEYIAVFIDSVSDEMAAITSSCNSLHARYVEALAAIDEWKANSDEWKDNFEAAEMASSRRLEEKIELQKEIDKLKAQSKIDQAFIKASLSSIHAANDNR